MKKSISFMIVLHFPFTSCSDKKVGPCGGGGVPENIPTSKIREINAKSGYLYPSGFQTSDTLEEFEKSTIWLKVTKIELKKVAFKASLINRAMACSYAIPPSQKIENIKIFSNKLLYFSKIEAKKNSNVSQFFSVLVSGNTHFTIDKYLLLVKKDPKKRFGVETQSLFFKLNQKPSQPIENHDITIELTMDDGAVYRATAKGFNVKINPSTKP